MLCSIVLTKSLKAFLPLSISYFEVFGCKFIFRSTIREITEEGPSKLRSLDDDSEITFQLGLILRLGNVTVLLYHVILCLAQFV